MTTRIDTQGTLAIEHSRAADYFSLTKPELTFLSVLTALGGFCAGAVNGLPAMLLFHLLLGTALLGGGAGTLNQYIERNLDRLMKRTEHRPLASGRLSPNEGLVFGIGLVVCGVIELVTFVNVLTALLGACAFFSYLFLYTPLKRFTPYATLVGALPGALPPVMGWTAIRNNIGLPALLLFAILVFWQMPHFLSLAWIYRRDYARAGYKLLTVADETGSRTSLEILAFAFGLLALTLVPWVFGFVGVLYATGAMVIGSVFLIACIRFRRERSNAAAHRIFLLSLGYLPIIMVVGLVDRFVRG